MKRLVIPFSLLVFSLTAQDLALRDLMNYRFPASMTGSGTEGMIAWVENREGVRNIYIAAGGDYRSQQVTQYVEDDGQAIGNLIFTDDHESILYVRGGAPNRSGEYPNPTSNVDGYKREIHFVSIETGFPRLLGEGSSPVLQDTTVIFLRNGSVWTMNLFGENDAQLFRIRGGVGSLRLSPDKQKLAFVNSRGDHAFIGVYNFIDNSLIFLDPTVDLDSDPVWSPDGSRIAFLRFPHQDFQIFTPQRSALPFEIRVADLQQSGSKRVWQADEGKGSAFRGISARDQIFWTKDDQIVFPWEKNGWTLLYSVPVSGGNATILTPGEFEIQFVSMARDRSRIYYSGNQNDVDRQHIWSVSPGSKPVQHTSGAGIEWSPRTDADGNLFFLGSDGFTPASVKMLKGKNAVVIQGTEDYPSDKLVTPQQITFSAADGMKINGQLFVPKDLKKGDKRPAVLFFHGGSRRQMLLGFHHRGYYHNAYAMNQYLAGKGYVVLSVNYRSGIGYGMEFREALNYGAAGASEFNDVLGAGLYLQNHPNVDTERIGLWGGSYGGYLTALGLAKASHLFKAGVDIHGVTDWNVVIKNFIPGYNALEDPEFSKLAYESSPIAHMKTWKSPVLLIHGDDDRNVPFSETVDKIELLRKNGVYYEHLVFPDEVHGFLLHSNWVKAYEATADFFDRMLKE